MKYVIESTLDEFGCEGTVVDVKTGPIVETYLVKPGRGVRSKKIVALEDDLALRMGVDACRIDANLTGVPYLGIEVPRQKPDIVRFWPDKDGKTLPMSLGVDTMGQPVTFDLAKAPHLLVAGATGSGKSVAVHTILASLLYQYRESDLRLVLIDPKMLEFGVYNGLPHLMTPVLTDSEHATKVAQRLVEHMDVRYQHLAAHGCRDIGEFRAKGGRMPYIVVVVDEWADLYMQEGKAIERPLVRLAQKARAAGIHIVLATQRPTVKVVSGLIKANFPARMALRVTNKTDSRVVLDQNGAESLLGRGDMLVQGFGLNRVKRVHGAYIDPARFLRLK